MSIVKAKLVTIPLGKGEQDTKIEFINQTFLKIRKNEGVLSGMRLKGKGKALAFRKRRYYIIIIKIKIKEAK